MEGYGKRVLMVERDGQLRDLLALVLSQAGYHVQAVCNGVEALDELKRRRFDVIVTGYHVTEINGMQLVALCRIVWPEMPAVLISTDAPDTSIWLGQPGVCVHLRKPFELTKLLESVCRAIDQSDRALASLSAAR